MASSPTLQPLSHHEILSLVEPFSRSGRQVDLAASQRLERRIAFKPRVHPAVSAEGFELSESLQLENTRAGRYRLTRTLTFAAVSTGDDAAGLIDPLQARLHADGADPAVLLQAIDQVPLARQFFTIAGCRVALEQLLPMRSDDAALPPPADRLILSNALTHLHGLTLSLRVPAVTGVPADIKLMAETGDSIELPDDLLAVLGWPWSRLQRVQPGWTGVMRLGGKDEGMSYTRSAEAQAHLRRTIEHLARTLAEPPARFHERLSRQRWGVTLRRAFPALMGVALLLGAAAVPKIDLAEDSVLRMLIFHAPPLLLVVFFCLREMPRIEIPPRPRAATAPSWRASASASANAGANPGAGAAAIASAGDAAAAAATAPLTALRPDAPTN